MIISKMHLPRRTVLRGIGATIALPLLDAMVPAFASAAAPVRRFVGIYVPNGMAMPYWTPKAEGGLDTVMPILEPIAKFKDRLLMITATDNTEVEAVSDGGTHPRAMTAWLTGVCCKRTEGSDVHAGTSIDQLLAQEFGKETQLASMELSLEDVSIPRNSFPGYAGVYNSTIVWRSATQALPMEHNPRVLFERMFGATESTNRQGRLDQINADLSLLDGVTPKIERLRKRLGAQDRAKLDEHLESVRDVERRIQKAESQIDVELPAVDKPRGVPPTFEEHAKLMYDLIVLAFKTDLTRVTTYMYGVESTDRAFPEIGIPEPWHPVSHHVNDPEKIKRQAKLNTYCMQMLQHFLEHLSTTKDGDGTLLDSTAVLYGSGLSDSNMHTHLNLPVLIAAGRNMGMQTGRHLVAPKGAPYSNVLLSIIDKMNVRGVEHFGNSTGRFDGRLSL
jgi:hypothetical protein